MRSKRSRTVVDERTNSRRPTADPPQPLALDQGVDGGCGARYRVTEGDVVRRYSAK